MKYGDEGHNLGYCLYKLGCKGPVTHANCSLSSFVEVPGAWPVGIGHPCFGCTESTVGFHIPLHDTVEIKNLTPPGNYPPIAEIRNKISPLSTGVAGAIIGAAAGAGAVFSKFLSKEQAKDEAGGQDKENKS